MPVNTLDHVNIRTSLMAESLAFYGDVLGMAVTGTPGTENINEGAWVTAADGRPVVHLNLAKDGRDFLGDDHDWSAVRGSARVHHVAFDCEDYDALVGRIAKAGLSARFNLVEAINLRQVFVHDPNGILIELNFR